MARLTSTVLLLLGAACLVLGARQQRARVLQNDDGSLPFGSFCHQPEGQPWCSLTYDIFLTKQAPALPAKSKEFMSSALLKGQAMVYLCAQAQNASTCKSPCKWTTLSGSYSTCMVDQEKWVSKTYCPKSQAMVYQTCLKYPDSKTCAQNKDCYFDNDYSQCSAKFLKGLSADANYKFMDDFKLMSPKVWGCCDAYSYQKTMQTWDYGYFPSICEMKAGQCEPSQYCASHPEVPDSCIVSPAGHFRLLFGENTTLANWAVEMGEKYCTYSQEAAWCNPPDDAPSLTYDSSKVSGYIGMKLPQNRPFPAKTCKKYLPFTLPDDGTGARRLREKEAK